jgi:methionyl-tRNA formyltransferase
VPLDDDITPDRLRTRLDPVIRDLLTTALGQVAAGVSGHPQAAAGTSHAPFLEPEFSRVDWSRPAREVHHQVRMFRFMGHSDAPVARVGQRRLRLVRTSLQPAEGIRVECGDGPIWIVESAPAQTPPTQPVTDDPGSG